MRHNMTTLKGEYFFKQVKANTGKNASRVPTVLHKERLILNHLYMN